MLNESIQLFSLRFGRRVFGRVFGPVFDRVSGVVCLGACLLRSKGVIHVQDVCSFVNVSKSFCNLLLLSLWACNTDVLNESIQFSMLHSVLGLLGGVCLAMCIAGSCEACRLLGVCLIQRRGIIHNSNSFVTFLSWIYWLGTYAFNAAGHMGALL